MKAISLSHLYVSNFISYMLMVLWFYTVSDKVYDFDVYRHSMMVQVFSEAWASVLVYTLPATEWLAFCLLLFTPCRWFGLLLSSTLLVSFTIYVGLAVCGFYPKMPCSCGGLFRKLSWNGHLILNAGLSTLSVIGNLNAHRGRKEVPDN